MELDKVSDERLMGEVAASLLLQGAVIVEKCCLQTAGRATESVD